MEKLIELSGSNHLQSHLLMQDFVKALGIAFSFFDSCTP